MSHSRMMFSCTSAGKTFSILKFEGSEGQRYSVSESGIRLVWIFHTLEEAYTCLMKRAHQNYQIAIAKQVMSDSLAAFQGGYNE